MAKLTTAPGGPVGSAHGLVDLAALLIVFTGSGCAALMYEIVWFQLLQLVVGSSAVALGVLLATFMGGLSLGSLLLPRLITAHTNPLRVVAAIEVCIGGWGLLSLVALPVLDHVYASVGGSRMVGTALLAMICVLPGTTLMGASLPAAARYVESSPHRVSWIGLLYAANTVGAVFGCLFAGFYLLRVYDMPTAVYAAAAINVTVAVLCYRTRGRSRPGPAADSSVDAYDAAVDHRGVYLAVGLSGLTALGAEVVWTRLLSVMLGATTYTLSIILAVFLGGLGIGGALGSRLADTTRRPRTALGICQIMVAVSVAWAAFTLADALPYWPIDPLLARSPIAEFEVERTNLFSLPTTRLCFTW